MNLEVKPLDKQKSTKSYPIPLTSFVQLIVGSRGSGKSNLLISELINPLLLKGRFHQIYLFSPTAKIDSKFEIVKNQKLTIINKSLINLLKKEKKHQKIMDGVNDIPEYEAQDVNFVDDFDFDLLKEVIDENKYISETYGKKYCNKTLFLFDDLASSKFFNDARFKKYIFNSRHFEISSIILTQSYYAIPKSIRLNISQLILFEIPNQKELKEIYAENNSGLDYLEFKEVYEYVHQQSYNFININYFNPKKKRIYKNFTESIQI